MRTDRTRRSRQEGCLPERMQFTSRAKVSERRRVMRGLVVALKRDWRRAYVQPEAPAAEPEGRLEMRSGISSAETVIAVEAATAASWSGRKSSAAEAGGWSEAIKSETSEGLRAGRLGGPLTSTRSGWSWSTRTIALPRRRSLTRRSMLLLRESTERQWEPEAARVRARSCWAETAGAIRWAYSSRRTANSVSEPTESAASPRSWSIWPTCR